MNKISLISWCICVFVVNTTAKAMIRNNADTAFVNNHSIFYSHENLANPWSDSKNPAGQLFHQTRSISRLQSSLNLVDRNIKRAMDPGKQTSFNISTESLQTIGKFKVRGLFGYQNQHYNDLLYNGNMDFRYMNIYMLGDTIGGKQRQEGYFFNASASYPLLAEQLYVGIGMDYEAAVGAKTVDLRNQNDIVRATFRPGIIYNANRFSAGINAGYITETNFTNVESYQEDRNTLYYHMGMGHYSASGNFSSAESVRYDGKGGLAGMQFQYTGNQWSSFHCFDYSALETTALVGSTYRLINGITDFNRIVYNGNLKLENNRYLHYFLLNANLATTKATEVRQESYGQFENGLYRTYVRNIRWVENKHIVKDYSGGLEYQFIKRGNDQPVDFIISTTANAGMYKASHYPVENYGFYEATSVLGGISYKGFLKYKGIQIDPVVGVNARFVISKDAVFKPFPNYFASIPETDYRFFSEDYYMGKLGANITSTPLQMLKMSRIFMEINSTYTFFPNIDLEDNFNFLMQFSLGVLF